MVARIIDVRDVRMDDSKFAEISCEVTRLIDGKYITVIVNDLLFDSAILRHEKALVHALQDRLRKLFPSSDPKRYIGLEIRIDGE